MAKTQIVFGEVGGGSSINPQFGIQNGVNTSSFTYVSVPQKPKYIMVNQVNTTLGLTIFEYDIVNDKWYATNSTHAERIDVTTTLVDCVDIQNNQVGFKLAASNWGSTWFYTFAF